MKYLPLTVFTYGLCTIFHISEAHKSFTCKSDGIGLRENQRCDGQIDCLDCSDEEETMCLAYECDSNYGLDKCDDGLQCYFKYNNYCDGKIDCKDKSDEPAAEICKDYSCLGKPNKCKDGIQCIGYLDLCDGKVNCNDNSDEDPEFCKANECINDDYVKCKEGLQCVYRGFLCDVDGKSECRDKSDEDKDFCRANKCKTGHLYCNDDLTCVSVTLMCDGQDDCEDKTDENPDFCKDFLPLPQ